MSKDDLKLFFALGEYVLKQDVKFSVLMKVVALQIEQFERMKKFLSVLNQMSNDGEVKKLCDQFFSSSELIETALGNLRDFVARSESEHETFEAVLETLKKQLEDED
jgi:hypothetical protein